MTPASGFEPESEAPQASRISKLPHTGYSNDILLPDIENILKSGFKPKNNSFYIIVSERQ